MYPDTVSFAGYAGNPDDGSVKVVAEGEREKLQQLITKLEAGPRAARVERVEVEWREYSGRYRGFDIAF